MKTYQASGGECVTSIGFCHVEMNVLCSISHVWNKAHREFPVRIILGGDFHNQEILSGSVCIDPLLHGQIHGLEPFVEHSLTHVQRVRGFSFDAIDFEIDRCRGRDSRSVSVLVQIHRVYGVFLRVCLAIEDARHMHGIAVDHCANVAIRYRWHEVTILAKVYRCSAVSFRQFICDETSWCACCRGRTDY